MIHYVVTETGSFSIRIYLAEEGRALADRMRVVTYEELPRLNTLPAGVWVFTEFDLLDTPLRDVALLVSDRLRAASGVRIVNDPRDVRWRVDLLRAAHIVGLNEFQAWPATKVSFITNGTIAADTVSAAALRYPVFVRFADRHIGSLTPLIDSPRGLEKEIAVLMGNGARRDELLVVEFCDTRDAEGIVRKYSAYLIGDRVVPRYLECSRDWMVKWDARIFDRVRADEETRYLGTNPHDAWIREVCRLARIEYGRVDYGVHDGRPQLWEINTNSTIGRGPGPVVPQRPDIVAYKQMVAPAFAAFYASFGAAWDALDDGGDGNPPVALSLPPALLRAAHDAERRRRRLARVDSALGVVARQPWVRPLTRAVKRGLSFAAALGLRRGR